MMESPIMSKLFPWATEPKTAPSSFGNFTSDARFGGNVATPTKSLPGIRPTPSSSPPLPSFDTNEHAETPTARNAVARKMGRRLRFNIRVLVHRQKFRKASQLWVTSAITFA
jgi:hypothetical protein